jgi:eukaryotic translation initiation factor 2C
MSGRGSGNQRGRGNSNQRGRGGARGGRGDAWNGGHGTLNATICFRSFEHTTAPQPPRQQFEQRFDSMSIKDKVAVDSSALQMGRPVDIPDSNPMEGNKVDPKAFQDIVKDLKASGLQSKFPLRQGFANPTTTVFTNHFAIKLDPAMSLYEYNITGLPARVGRRTTMKLVETALDSIPFWKDNKDKIATDYQKTLITWAELPPSEDHGIGRTADWRDPVGIGFKCVGHIDVNLLQRYSEGKEQPSKVRAAVIV